MILSSNSVGLLFKFLEVFSLSDLFFPIVTAQTLEEARSLLETAKLSAKGSYRELAKLTHPDHGGDRNAFEAVTQVYQSFMSFELLPVTVCCPLCRGAGMIEADRLFDKTSATE